VSRLAAISLPAGRPFFLVFLFSGFLYLSTFLFVAIIFHFHGPDMQIWSHRQQSMNDASAGMNFFWAREFKFQGTGACHDC
jgi:hypothetical protein